MLRGEMIGHEAFARGVALESLLQKHYSNTRGREAHRAHVCDGHEAEARACRGCFFAVPLLDHRVSMDVVAVPQLSDNYAYLLIDPTLREAGVVDAPRRPGCPTK